MKRRITDEQAKTIRDGFFQTLTVDREYDENGNSHVVIAGDLAADLLDAVETIRAMREIFEAITCVVMIR